VALFSLAPLAAVPLEASGVLDFFSLRALGYSSYGSRWVRDQGLLLPLIPPQRLLFV
jgi:hypothetical protein